MAEKQEQMKEHAEKWKKSHEGGEGGEHAHHDHGQRCSWKPSALIGCVKGFTARVRKLFILSTKRVNINLFSFYNFSLWRIALKQNGKQVRFFVIFHYIKPCLYSVLFYSWWMQSKESKCNINGWVHGMKI